MAVGANGVKVLQNVNVFQKQLQFLEKREDLCNIVILDYGSLNGGQRDLNFILRCWFLRQYFHVILLVNHLCIPNTYNHQNCTVINVSSELLRCTHPVCDHVAAQIMIYLSKSLYRYRRAYYCLSEDRGFPDRSQFMECTDHEFVYCSVIRSVQDFLEMEHGHFQDNDINPAIMNVFPLLRNDIPCDRKSDNSGKLMTFIRGEEYYKKHVSFLWEELKQFGNANELPVSVTTAFPAVDYLEVQHYPHLTTPEFYRFLVYVADALEEKVLSILDHFRSTQFEGTIWSVKLDKLTSRGVYASAGDKDIATAIYKVCKYSIKKQYRSEGTTVRHFEVIEDEDMKRLVQEAKNKSLTMKIRHAKVLFCGASGVGKTSFACLLKNERLKAKQRSTGLGDLQQIMVTEKASVRGSEWVDLNPNEEIHQLKLRMHHRLIRNNEQLSLQANSSNDDQYNNYSIAVVNETRAGVSSVSDTLQVENVSLQGAESTEIEKRLCSKSPNLGAILKPSEVWDILTLLDTGGQPQFINMLPAVNTSATITFVVLNMLGGAEGLEKRVQVHHYDKQGEISFEPYPLNYTNKDLIKCLVALLKDSVLTDRQIADVFVSKQGTNNKPQLCFVGTHLDKVNQQDVELINEKLEELVNELEPNDNISIWKLGKLLFAVNNTLAGTEMGLADSMASEIRCEVKKLLQTKDVYEVPIVWMILEQEIRLVCNKQRKCFMLISEVEKLYGNISVAKDIQSEVRAALRFHHMFGVLLYFHEVPGMNNFVISESQWLFANLTNLVCCSFVKEIVDQNDLNNFKSKGILSNSLVTRINTTSLEGIVLQDFIELLKYLKIITPYPTNDSSDYLMLTVLDSFKGEVDHFLKDTQLQGVDLLIQLQSRTFPRGIFCCLVVQLIRKKSEVWKLQSSLDNQRCVYQNLVIFCTDCGHYIFLYDKVSYLQIQIRRNVQFQTVHFEVQQSITEALLEICSCTLQYGFYCNQSSCAVMKLSQEHVTEKKPLPLGLQCDEHGWFELRINVTQIVV